MHEHEFPCTLAHVRLLVAEALAGRGCMGIQRHQMPQLTRSRHPRKGRRTARESITHLTGGIARISHPRPFSPGATRTMALQTTKSRAAERNHDIYIALESGSLLLLAGETMGKWEGVCTQTRAHRFSNACCSQHVRMQRPSLHSICRSVCKGATVALSHSHPCV